MADIEEMIKQEWRDLGFYYELEENNDFKQWRFYGSKQGLFNFINLLEIYTTNKSNDYISEHDHYGPYNYLKIMTWNKPEITENCFAGTIADLNDLKGIVARKLDVTGVGQTFVIGKEYGEGNTANARFFVMADDFDPVSMDDNYNESC
jgi:hypothetical protein